MFFAENVTIRQLRLTVELVQLNLIDTNPLEIFFLVRDFIIKMVNLFFTIA